MIKDVRFTVRRKSSGDYFLLIAVVILAIVGTVFIYSASNYSAKDRYNDAFYFVKKQAIGIALGIVAMVFTSVFDYRRLKRLTIPISIIAVITLVLVFVPGTHCFGSCHTSS